MPTRIIIAALSENRAIGWKNELPWDIPEDYQQYLNFVRGNTLIMGRKTYEGFSDDLQGTNDLVVTRSGTVPGNALAFPSIEAALRHAETLPHTIFIAGGASIYEQTLELADEMYLSHIHGTFEGDAFFPEFDPDPWEVVKREPHERFTFVHYRRKG